MATFVVLRQPLTILVTDFTNPKNLSNNLLILILFIPYATDGGGVSARGVCVEHI